jgi:hypothetical protein
MGCKSPNVPKHIAMGLAFPAAGLIMLRMVFGTAKNLKIPKKPIGDSKLMIRRPDREKKVKKPRGAKMHWTAEDKNELKRLAQTTNIHELARRFKRTPSAILAMAYKLDIPLTMKKKCLVKGRETGFSRSIVTGGQQSTSTRLP